jgi:TolB-like protein/DNA-binding SARP family transcriptional activator
MSGLELRLLGGYEGRLPSGEALALPTRKAWALLAFLALHPGREMSRERLATLLWSQRFDEQARASLRQTLYELRSGLGEQHAGLVVAKRDTVCVQADGMEVDVQRLERALGGADADLEAVASLYRGPLLDGLETGEPVFDEWLAAERARLQSLACGALERLATAHLDGGRTQAAIETAHRLIQLDPLGENAHRLLMRGLAAEGRRSEALKQFKELERILQGELGVTPDGETLDLRDELMRAGAARPDAPAMSPSGSPNSPPIESVSLGSARMRGSWRPIAAVAVVLLAIVAVGSWWLHAGRSERVAEAASASDPAARLAAKPSIAVLPFANLSTDPEGDRLAAGLTEDLITALSKAWQLLVIARTSVAGYAGKAVKAHEIGEDLGVRYVLEGSVQKADEDLRITVNLVDARADHSLWSERFDREASQLFDLQDDIVRRVLVELQVELTDGEHARIASRGTTNLDAWLLRLQAMEQLYQFTRESTIKTRALLEAAHRLDPGWSRPLGGLAWSYWWEARQGWTDDREGWIRKGIELAEQAIEADPDDTLGYMQLGNLAQLQGDHDRAIALREKAVEIAPNDFQANWGLGAVLSRAGEAERAVEVLELAAKLSRRPPASLLWTLAQAQLIAGRYEDAIESATRASALSPEDALPHVHLAAAHSGLGRTDEARAAAARVLETDPAFSVARWQAGQQDYREQAAIDRLADLLTEAGLPE